MWIAPKRYSKGILQSLYDLAGLPVRVAFPVLSSRIGLISINQERWDIAAHYARGLVLDVGCGKNEFIRAYKGEGYGVDPYFSRYANAGAIADKLPFPDKTFDTVTFLACLNHIPKRVEAMREAKRVLKDDGIVIITMLTPLIGYWNHKLLFWLSEDNARKQKPGEKDGLSEEEIYEIAQQADMRVVLHQPFFYGLNHAYVLYPARSAAGFQQEGAI